MIKKGERLREGKNLLQKTARLLSFCESVNRGMTRIIENLERKTTGCNNFFEGFGENKSGL
jgi:hypothetical protein